MRQTRLVLMVGGGVLLLCVLALIVSLADYTSQPAVANAHVPPVVGPQVSDVGSPPPPAIPVTTVDPPTPAPTATPQRGRFPLQQPTLAQILQQLEQRRHHRLPPQTAG